jgi:subtilase family serine protease
MKTIILSFAALVMTLNMSAQIQNVTEVSKTTITTTKDSDGEKQSIKKQDIKEVQNVELENPNSNALNKDMKPTQVDVTSKTQIINPDGSTRTVDLDRSSYYESNGKKVQLSLDANGYSMIMPETKTKTLLRKTSTNSYILKSKNKFAIGYFDTDGNLIIESYDDKSDRVSVETFKISK